METPNLVLPDFDDIYQVSTTIRDLVLKRDTLEIEIKKLESEVYKRTATDTNYFVAGKPPSASFVKATYEFTGLEGEILPLRQEYALTCANLEQSRILLESMKMQVDLYRTESANRRHAGY